MAQTANYGFEKPSTDKNVDEEFYQLQETLDLLDSILAALQTAVNGKSAVGHTHAIADVVNLAAELAAKMPASQTFKLDDLTDVSGADGAPNNYILVKSALGWLPSSALAALGTHGHLISEITGLVDALAGKADAAATTTALAGKADAAATTTALAGKASLTGVETLTNKTLTAPVVNAPSGEFLRGHINGLTLSNNASDATNDLDIATGSAGSDGTTPVLMTLASAITKRLDASWAVGSGNGCLDAGTVGNNTYHLFEIQRSDTGVTDILASLSSTSPTMPTNYDRKRRIGYVVRSGGVNGIPVNVGRPLIEYAGTAPCATARALVTFSGAAAIIGYSMNVSSITRHGAGDFTMNLIDPVPIYMPVGSCQSFFSTDGGAASAVPTSTSFRFSTVNLSGVRTDYTRTSVALLG